MSTSNPIFCAIDTTDIEQARALIHAIAPHVGGIKLGLEFFTRHGADGLRQVTPEGLPLFLDLKFHDIPNTVAGAVRSLSDLNIYMLTIHASGGHAMMAAAKKEALALPTQPKVLGVTVLTSMAQEDVTALGLHQMSLTHYAAALALQAKEAGLDGVVCSGHELADLRSQAGSDLLYVVPGIRPQSALSGASLREQQASAGGNIKDDDQKRVMTPKEAMAAGASYLVIGRPITQAADPAAAAEAIVVSLG